MKVKFNITEEFIEEMKKDRDEIERAIIRLTTLKSYSEKTPGLYLISVISTYRRGDEIIELKKFCGDVFGKEDAAEVWERVQQVYTEIEKAAKELGLEIRPGVYE